MRVAIADIPEEGLRVHESCDPAALGLETSEITYAEPLGVSARIQRHDDDLLVAVEATSTRRMVCGRCLATFQQPYHGEFHLAIEIQGRVSVDLTEDIRQEILLSDPMTLLCRQECRGLCPRCGQNLNEGPCGCTERVD